MHYSQMAKFWDEQDRLPGRSENGLSQQGRAIGFGLGSGWAQAVVWAQVGMCTLSFLAEPKEAAHGFSTSFA